MFNCKGEKVLEFLSVQNILQNWFNLAQFCCVWILALSRQAPRENIQFLGYWEELFLFFFFEGFLWKIFIFITDIIML